LSDYLVHENNGINNWIELGKSRCIQMCIFKIHQTFSF